MSETNRLRAGWIAPLLGAIALASCKPDYPKCDKDEHCRKGEYCVGGLCQQCRDSADCGKGRECKDGRCEAIPGWCESAADCPEGQGCVDNRCGACDADAQCGAGGRCKQGVCLTAGRCVDDSDCGDSEECQDGRCVAPPAAGPGAPGPCELAPVYFDFNESLLTTEAKAVLASDAECLKGAAGRTARVEGHCDPRGTEEYNLALGDRRARSVVKHLSRLGADEGRLRPVSRGKLEAKGYDEGTWARDRRADPIWE